MLTCNAKFPVRSSRFAVVGSRSQEKQRSRATGLPPTAPAVRVIGETVNREREL